MKENGLDAQELATLRKKLRLAKMAQPSKKAWHIAYRDGIDAAINILRKEVHNAARRKKTLRKLQNTIKEGD